MTERSDLGDDTRGVEAEIPQKDQFHPSDGNKSGREMEFVIPLRGDGGPDLLETKIPRDESVDQIVSVPELGSEA